MSSTEAAVRQVPDPGADRTAIYSRLMVHASGQGNDDALARMYASWSAGMSALPPGWGLSVQACRQLVDWHFPGIDQSVLLAGGTASCAEWGEEHADLVGLMLDHRAGASASEVWMAKIVATACLGSDHLWQDLGLWCREDLSQLMARNFPTLSALNVHNMKWKKFLYKQLCQSESIFVCRAPSCEVCVDYESCFGPED